MFYEIKDNKSSKYFKQLEKTLQKLSLNLGKDLNGLETPFKKFLNAIENKELKKCFTATKLTFLFANL